MHHKPDHLALKPAAVSKPISYPKPDGIVSFDRLSSVFVSNTNHEENQPSHLKLKDPDAAITVNLAVYDSPEQRYCPAGVYEIVDGAGVADQRAELRPLQELRHQGSDAEHRLDGSGRRRRPELSEYVSSGSIFHRRGFIGYDRLRTGAIRRPRGIGGSAPGLVIC